MSALAIRRMTLADLEMAVDWARIEGWNPGVGDAEAYYLADPNGFLVGTIDGTPVATLSVVAYDDSFGFLGFYIVRSEFRGQGHGIALWNAGMAYLGQRNIALDGVVAQQPSYRRSGFALAHRNIRFQGTVSPGGDPDPALEPLAAVPLADVVACDRAHFPAPRRAFVERWVTIANRTGYAIRRDGRLTGFGCIRPAASGHRIGPLYAATADDAERLFRALAASARGEPIALDVPETNPAAVALAEAAGMTRGFETARMYTGPFPALPVDQIYGITSFELG